MDGGGIDVPDLWTIDEIENMVRKPDGRVEAGRGHDDKAMCIAMAVAVEKCALPHVPNARRLDRWELDDMRPLQPIKRGAFW